MACNSTSFQPGRDVDMFPESKVMPRKVMVVAGLTVFSEATGTPGSLQVCRHSGYPGWPKSRKSLIKCITAFTPSYGGSTLKPPRVH